MCWKSRCNIMFTNDLNRDSYCSIRAQINICLYKLCKLRNMSPDKNELLTHIPWQESNHDQIWQQWGQSTPGNNEPNISLGKMQWQYWLFRVDFLRQIKVTILIIYLHINNTWYWIRKQKINQRVASESMKEKIWIIN